VPLRRVRSNSWHAREKVSGPETQPMDILQQPSRTYLKILTIYIKISSKGKARKATLDKYFMKGMLCYDLGLSF